MGVYIIRNKVNGKIYVGSSINIKKRWREHISKLNGKVIDNTRLFRAWKKYGSNSFEFLVVEKVSVLDEILPAEQKWIDLLNATGPLGYNILPSAGNCAGRIVSEETRNKIRSALIGRKASAETRAKMSESHRGIHVGKFVSPETRQKIRLKNLGRRPSQQELDNRRRAMTPEYRRRISVSIKKKWEAGEYRTRKWRPAPQHKKKSCLSTNQLTMNL